MQFPQSSKIPPYFLSLYLNYYLFAKYYYCLFCANQIYVMHTALLILLGVVSLIINSIVFILIPVASNYFLNISFLGLFPDECDLKQTLLI